MKLRRFFRLMLLLTPAIILLAACAAPQMAATREQKTEAPPAEVAHEGQSETQSIERATQTQAAQPTQAPAIPASPTLIPQSSQGAPLLYPTSQPTSIPTEGTETEQFVAHIVEVEWPKRLQLGESDVLRMALVPLIDGYVLTTEFPEHTVITQTIQVRPVQGYDLYAVGRLDGGGFLISPEAAQEQYLHLGETLTWLWSIKPEEPGNQRLSLTLILRWKPLIETATYTRDVAIYSAGLDIQVVSFLGLTQGQAMVGGILGLIFGSSLSLYTITTRTKKSVSLKPAVDIQSPNMQLILESPAGLHLSHNEEQLLRTIFRRYERLVILSEFLSGYSGARTFLVLPVHKDGRADAHTIAKLGEIGTILREYENYETYVKDTLPPVTARIQHPPITTSTAANKVKVDERGVRVAALQYTFIGKPGSTPTSLSQALLDNPDPDLLVKLIDTFGPNWWLQRKPYSFRLGVEYDRMLPTHLVLEPATGKSSKIDGNSPPGVLQVKTGDIVKLQNLAISEVRSDGSSLSLIGKSLPGQPPLRVRWLSLEKPEGAIGRVLATRHDLLLDYTKGFDLLELPNPFQRLPDMLSETVSGSQSTIHGDLNLENILLGPGGMVWLIDFAQTRDGHTLYDFAHLEAEIIAHIIAPQISSAIEYLSFIRDRDNTSYPDLRKLIDAMHELSDRCLFNLNVKREYHLALAMACLGALKFTNLNPHQKHLLLLTGAELLSIL